MAVRPPFLLLLPARNGGWKSGRSFSHFTHEPAFAFVPPPHCSGSLVVCCVISFPSLQWRRREREVEKAIKERKNTRETSTSRCDDTLDGLGSSDCMTKCLNGGATEGGGCFTDGKLVPSSGSKNTGHGGCGKWQKSCCRLFSHCLRGRFQAVCRSPFFSSPLLNPRNLEAGWKTSPR